MLEPKDYKTFNPKQTFYRAVIEDNNDPKKMGRVRVRIMGLHSEIIEDVPVDTLPWAEVAVMPMFGMNTGIGLSSVPLKGTWCWVFLENNDYNHPVVFAMSLGTSVDVSADPSFKDPSGTYPLKDRLNEPDFNRIARNEKLDQTIVKKIDDTADKHAEFTAKDGIEPLTLNAKSVYPNVTVIESPTGHVIEIDDTVGNERIRLYHKKGSYMEIRPDGSIVTKSVKNTHEITNEQKYEHVIKSIETVIGNNSMLHIYKDSSITVDGNETTAIKGNRVESVKGKETITVSGKANHTYSSGLTVNGGPNITAKAGVIHLN